MKEKPITVEQCCCGHKNCRSFWLVGIGSFCQGSGFEESEAKEIAFAVNQHRAVRRRAKRNADMVPRDGAAAFMQGWGPSQNPHVPASVEGMRWTSAWWAANADAFESHIKGE